MRRHLGTFLIATGLLLMAWPVMTWAYGTYWQGRLAGEWERAHRSALAPSPAPAGDPEHSAAPPFARLRVERIGLDAIVIDGIDAVSLRRGPAHVPETGRPGESRNCAIAAHRDGWFRRLNELLPGDLVRLETADCGFDYMVDERMVVDPDRADLLATTGSYPTLTLITCTGPMQPRSLYRLLVFCRLQSVRPF